MIYLFGSEGQEVSIVYSGLNEEQKSKAIQVTELPVEPVEKANFRTALVNRSGVPTWEYIDTKSIVDSQIEEAIDEYTLSLIEGGLL